MTTLGEIKSSWPATVDVTAAAKVLGIGRSTAYDLIARGEFPVRTIPVGTRHRVVTADLIRLLSADEGAVA